MGDAVSGRSKPASGASSPSAPVLPTTRPRTQASPLVGSEDRHNLWGPPQPEQTSRPSVLVVTLVFCAVHSPLFGWDPRDTGQWGGGFQQMLRGGQEFGFKRSCPKGP